MKSLFILLAVTSLVACLPCAGRAQTLKPVAFFDGSQNEFPESIAIDHRGNLYLSEVNAGKITKVTPAGVKSDFAFIDDWSLLGLTFDREGNLVVAGGYGIWKVSPDGTPWLFAPVPGRNYLNDLIYDQHGNLYVTDDFKIWKIDPMGNAVVWSEDPLFQPSVTFFPYPVGCNGIKFSRDMKTLFVSNTSAGRILTIGVRRDGRAGPARILADDPSLIGADGLEVDDHNNVLVAVNYQDRIARVSRDGRISVVVEGDILSCPTSLVLSRGSGPRSHQLFICNNGNIFFSNDPIGEGLLRLDLDDHCPKRPAPKNQTK